MHVGSENKKSKTEAMYYSARDEEYGDGGTSDLVLDCGSTISFTAGDYNRTIVAEFTSDPQVILSASENGSVEGAGYTTLGQTVTLTATPDSLFVFKQWSGQTSGLTLNGSALAASDLLNPTLTFTSDIDRTLVAEFEGAPQFEITTAIAVDATGTVEGAATVYENQEITLTATPADHYQFGSWTGDISGIATEDLTTSPITFTVTSARNLVANFVVEEHTITANATNGSVTGDGLHDYGATATLNASAAAHYHFVNWTGDVSDIPTENRFKETKTGCGKRSTDTLQNLLKNSLN